MERKQTLTLVQNSASSILELFDAFFECLTSPRSFNDPDPIVYCCLGVGVIVL